MTTPSRTALLLGGTGQDGAYLARHLLAQGYAVHVTGRGPAGAVPERLARLGIAGDVQVHSLALPDAKALRALLEQVRPDEVYNLSGESSVSRSFDDPEATYASIAVATEQLLHAVRALRPSTRVYMACSSEMFGDLGAARADERTPFTPVSPYGRAKAAAFQCVVTAREQWGLAACSGILFNHESPLRPPWFVTRKIVHAACAIKAGSRQPLELGDISIRRDWGWAPEYVVAMHRMLQQPTVADYVIATGTSHALEHLVDRVFAALDLDWREHVRTAPGLLRPAEIRANAANPARAARDLGWRAEVGMDELVQRLVDAERGGPL